MTDALSAAFVGFGALMFAAAGVGLVRFPTTYSRLHAWSKAASLGLMCLVLGAALRLDEWSHAAALVIVGIFQVASAPVSAHVVARAAYRSGRPLSSDGEVDELADRESSEDDDGMPDP